MSTDQPTGALPGGPDPDESPTTPLEPGGAGLVRARGPRSPDPGLAEKQIGPYTILSVLGEGGFGVVYLGERTEPITQRVAIKVIKPGMDSAGVMARFDLERRSLAVMDHPNVARVLDAGSTASGRPYFVMEYVPGEAITTFCDRRSFTIAQRLELMGQVCDAVQHAHLKGLIHRDLKPGNIMVELVDGKAIAKVIDFGIAKAIQQDSLAKESFTLEGMLIGTPEYMSPEQAGGEFDIDTRTDIYSLGVILYELLTGVLPFDARDLRSHALAEIQRIIREVDPPRPSTRLNQLGAATGEIARSRKTQSKSLERTLRRELEWIPLKAMRKDRARRYKTAQELRDDLTRYLKGEALLAGPESKLYRARKFTSRNKAPVAAAAVVLVSIIAAAAISVRFGISERRARIDEAAARAEATVQRDEATKQRDEAATQRDTAESVNSFLNSDLLGAINPEGDDENKSDPDIKVLTVLDRAAAAIGARLKDKPAVRARVLYSLGQAYLNLGRPAQARSLLEESLSIDDSAGQFNPDDRDQIVLALNESYWRQLETDAAMKYLAPAIDARRARLGSDAAAKDDLFAKLLHSLGGLHKWAGRHDEAEAAYKEALAIRTAIFPAEHPLVLSTEYNLIGIDEKRARTALFAAYAAKDEPAKAAAVQTMREVRDRMAALADRCAAALREGADTTLAARAETAYMTGLTGDFETSMRLYSELIPVMKRHLTDRHWRTLEASANLADGLRRTSRHAEAVPILADLVESYRIVRGPAFGDTVTITDWYANSLELTGQPDTAAAALERLFDDLKAANAKPSQLKALANGIANLFKRQGKEDAERTWRETAAHY